MSRKKRKLKPIPKLIFNALRILLLGVIAFYLVGYLFCVGLLINADQMDAKYDYLMEVNYGE